MNLLRPGNPIFLRSTRAADHMNDGNDHVQERVTLRLELSRLFCLCKFIFVVHAKCSFPAFCMNY